MYRKVLLCLLSTLVAGCAAWVHVSGKADSRVLQKDESECIQFADKAVVDKFRTKTCKEYAGAVEKQKMEGITEYPQYREKIMQNARNEARDALENCDRIRDLALTNCMHDKGWSRN